jgi:16S rRNA (guanine966-N2)-methyltransferase
MLRHRHIACQRQSSGHNLLFWGDKPAAHRYYRARSAGRRRNQRIMRRATRTVVIGGGTLRGRVLRYPDVAGLRPSMQRTKASVFSALAPWMDSAVFADLYAGAGAVGIEAISRGARAAHFVEQDRTMIDALRENLVGCSIDADRSHVHAAPVAQVMDARPCPIADATIVFADPPYDVDVGDDLLSRVSLDAMPALAWLVVEHRTRTIIEPPPGLSIERQRRFGDTTVTYFVPS